MDKDRIEGSAKQAKGAIKEVTGKAVGDAKLTADGKSDKVEGKVQNAVGGDGGDAVLGTAGIRSDHHAQGRRMADTRREAYYSMH